VSPAPPRARSLRLVHAGRISYAEGLALQRRTADALRAGEGPETLLLVEHAPVITLGRGGRTEHLLASEAALEAAGVALHPSDRGGDVTYHGPGQAVVYPILDLAPDRCDVRRYVCDLEAAMIWTCAALGLRAGRKEGMIGCWLGGEVGPGPWRKIGAVGVHLSRWITTHGLALNLAPDMDHFGLIVPCGIAGHGVTSVAAELGAAPSVETAHALLAGALAERLGARLVGAD